PEQAPLQPGLRSLESVLLVLPPREHITRAADRQDPAGMLRIILDGGPDARDMHVDRAVERSELLAPDEIHQPLAVEDAPGILGESGEEIELVAREEAL